MHISDVASGMIGIIHVYVRAKEQLYPFETNQRHKFIETDYIKGMREKEKALSRKGKVQMWEVTSIK